MNKKKTGQARVGLTHRGLHTYSGGLELPLKFKVRSARERTSLYAEYSVKLKKKVNFIIKRSKIVVNHTLLSM